MNPLQQRLASLRRRMILVNFWRGTTTLFAVVVGILLVEGLSDWKVHLPAALRGLFLVGTLTAFGFVFVRYLYQPMTKRLDDLSLALRIEEIYPELNDNLASAVQFLDQPEENLPGSKVMRQHAIEHALKRADHCDFSNIINRRGILVRPLAAVIIGVMAGYFAYHYFAFTGLAMVRLVDPFGSHSWTQIELDEAVPAYKAYGQPYVLKGRLLGILPDKEKATLELDVDTNVPSERVLHIKKAEENIGTFQTALDLTPKSGKFRFRIQANDGVFPTHGGFTKWIDVQAPPKLVPLDGQHSPQVELEYPAYTDLRSPERLSSGVGPQVDAVLGTKVRWRAAVDRPVKEAYLEFDPPGKLKVPCTIDANGTLLTLEFTPPAGVAVAKVHFKDKNGLGNSDKIEFNIFPDPAPTVHIKKPAWTVERILPDAQVTLEIAAADKTFALRSVYLEYRRKNSNGDFVGPATRVPIVHAQLSAAMVMLGQNYQGMALPAHIRPTFLELIFPWQLRGQFKEGEIVSIQVCADDFNNSIGASRTIDIVIASQRQFFEQVDAELEKLQKKVVNVLQDQEDSLKIVKDVQNAKNMDPRERRDKLDEAREKQKSIKNTIGAGPEEGMRREVDALKEKLAENKLPPSALQDNVNSLSKELDRISRDDLPQIEDLLAKSSRETAKVEPKPDVQPEPKPKTKPDGKPETKIEPKKKDSLEQARGFQEDAKKTLADLARTLEPWANQQQIKERLAKLVVEQKNLRRDTENLGAEGDKKPGKADLDPRADRQDDLAVQTEDLLRTIKEVKEKQKGTDVGDKLTAVDQIADEAKIPETMREVSGRLRKTEEPNLVDSVQKQDDIIKSLEKMLAALEEKDPAEQLDRLTRKQKKAQQEINDLQIKMNELDKKIDDARNNPDPMQRADMLKALAPEQQKLEEKARELSRELSRLHAEKASRDLERAAQEMADAKKKLDEGEDPMGDQQKAKKDLDRAKADLEQVRQELDRESLARIADKLKGIKERQDAFVADTERIFKTVEDMNKWTTGTQKSLKQSADVQTGLAKETDSFKEKLAQYPVFEHILKKAKSSMDKAADAVLKPSPDRGLAGEPLDEVNLAATKNDRDRIVKLEKEASERLDWLVEAIKEDLKDKEVKAAAPKKGEGEKQPNGDDPAANKANPNGTQGDGIPPAAELKLMIRDQEDIRNKTKAFDERFPNRDDLTEEQRAELRALEAEQAAIGELFERITNRNKEKGEEQ